MFDITEEFKITEEMENGKKHELTKDAYIVVRSSMSKIYKKGLRKIFSENDVTSSDLSKKETLELYAATIAEFCIVDIKNVSIGGKSVKNSVKSKVEALLWRQDQTDEEGDPPFFRMVQDLCTVGNFEGAGNSLKPLF